MTKIHKALFVFLFLCFSLTSMAQWKVLKGDWAPESHLSGNYLFYYTHIEENAFKRLDLRDTTYKTIKDMKKDSGAFFGGDKLSVSNQIRCMGRHVICTSEQVPFISHDYGDTWDSFPIPVSKHIVHCFVQEGVFGFISNKNFYWSVDSASSFKSVQIVDEDKEMIPKMLLGSKLFFEAYESNKTLKYFSVNLDGTGLVEVKDDRLIKSKLYNGIIVSHDLQKINLSLDSGKNWINRPNSDGIWLIKATDGGFFCMKRDASNNLEEYYITYDTFQTFLGISPKSTYSQAPTNMFLYNGDFFTSGYQGIHQLKRPNFTKRHVEGVVYLDLNADGVQNVGETGLANVLVRFNTGGWACVTNSLGNYSFDLVSGPDSVIIHSPVLTAHNTDRFWFTKPSDTVNFGLQVDTTRFELQPFISAASSINTIRGGTYNLGCINRGGKPVKTKLRFVVHPDMSISKSSEQYEQLNDSTYQWQLELKPMDAKSISCVLVIDTSTNLSSNDSIRLRLMASPSDQEFDPNHSYREIEQRVTTSYDPNDKSVWPENIDPDHASTGRKIQYHIRFQNTGTDTAYKVVIADTLDQWLMSEKLNILEYSHPMRMYVNGPVVHFIFDNILLPDSNTNQTGSNGYVTFECELRDGLKEGEEVNNTAFIYFDHNDAVKTNAATTVVRRRLSTHLYLPDSKKVVYPNPVSDILHVPVQGKVRIYSMDGLEVFSGSITHSASIDVSFLKPGSYILRVEDGSNGFVSRFIKQP
ncbi:MAG: T9SS type A sorting domain-containing protein [Bacteroidetes bacterium]|nr:T9SS type A sorting domain-containing protein [Bacteroidota bacterium]